MSLVFKYSHLILLVLFTFNSCDMRRSQDESRHVALSTPIVKQWQKIKVGKSVHQLYSPVLFDDSRIQLINFQTGVWRVEFEEGCSILRIYPNLKVGEESEVYQGIVVKLSEPGIGCERFLKEVSNENSKVVIVEYSTFGLGLDKHVPTED